MSARAPANPWLTLLLALAAAAAFVWLGLWQWHRGVARQREWDAFAAGTAKIVDPGTRALADLPLFQRVRVHGTLDGAHQFLLDNRSWQGRPGYEVLTPLARAGGALLLVDRGWVPFSGSRRILPAVGIAVPGELTLTGRLANLPVAGLERGRAPPGADAPWPKVTSFPDFGQLRAALGAPLVQRILLLDPDQPFGYMREWQAPGLPPLRHFSYALQWWCFAALALGAWAVSLRRRRVSP